MEMTTRTNEICVGEKVIDSRDVIARLSDLNDWRDAAIEEANRKPEDGDEAPEIWTAKDGTEYGVTVDWEESTEEEWRLLTALEEEASGSPNLEVWRAADIR